MPDLPPKTEETEVGFMLILLVVLIVMANSIYFLFRLFPQVNIGPHLQYIILEKRF